MKEPEKPAEAEAAEGEAGAEAAAADGDKPASKVIKKRATIKSLQKRKNNLSKLNFTIH
jgi:large subunit ribosomal protein L25